MSCQRAPETEQLDVSDPCNYNIPLWSAKKKKLGSPTKSKAVKHYGKRSFFYRPRQWLQCCGGTIFVTWKSLLTPTLQGIFLGEWAAGGNPMGWCPAASKLCSICVIWHKQSTRIPVVWLIYSYWKKVFLIPLLTISFVLLYFVFIFCSLVKQPHCSVLWWYRKHCSLSFTRIVHKLKTSTPKTWHYRKVLFQILRQPESLHISCSFNLESYWDRVIIYSSLKWIYNISIVKNCPLTQKEWLRLRMSNATYDQNIKKDKILYKMLHIYIVLCCTQIARIFISSFSLLFFSIYCSYKQRGYLKVNSCRQNS